MGIKYRLKFSKLDKMRFIGHLDLLKIFQRCIKRSNLPISFSQGFNPHQIISFALPLSLGMASTGEYTDFELEQEINPQQIIDRLNVNMPKGIEILNCRKLEKGEQNAAASVEAAFYEVAFPKFSNLLYVLENTLKQNEIIVEKKTKKSLKEVDIRPDIFSLKDVSTGDMNKIQMIISTGSNRNLKPETLVKYLYENTELEYNNYNTYYLRLDMYKKINNQFVSLFMPNSR